MIQHFGGLITLGLVLPSSLLKEYNAKTCDEHRLISLMNHGLKTFLEIIHKRIYGKYEEKSGDIQFSFKNSLDTREAMYCSFILFV
jgi:hypothetical protein